MMSRRKVSQSFFVLLTILGAASCSQPSGEEFSVPEIVFLEARVEGASATFTVAFSNDRIEECGIELQDGEALTPLPATLRGNTFSVTADKLEVGRQYTWSAYAKAGRCSIHSGSATFEVTEGLIPIPDPAFKKWLLSNGFDTDGDGEINTDEANAIEQIWMWDAQDGIESLQGIEYMPNLTHLVCSGRWVDSFDNLPEHYYISQERRANNIKGGPLGTLKRVDVSNNPKLVYLNLSHNEGLGETIGELDISNNTALEGINFAWNGLRIPDISHLNTDLTEFTMKGNPGDIPDFSRFSTLKILWLEFWDDNHDRNFSVDVSNCRDLEELCVVITKGTIKGISQNRKLRKLSVWSADGGNPETNAEILEALPYLTELEELTCPDCGLTSLDLSNNPKLTWVRCWGNKLQTLDVSKNLLLGTRDTGNPHDNGLVCPWGEGGNYPLETLYIAEGQVIPFINDGNRSEEHIPATTQIVYKPRYLPGDIVDCDGVGMIASLSHNGMEALLLSVTEIHDRPWEESNAWCMAYGEGWRMPTIDELTAIHFNYDLLNQKLRGAGYAPLTSENKCYWSCTPYELEAGYYYRERLYDGEIWYYGSDEWHDCYANYTRAVKTLKY